MKKKQSLLQEMSNRIEEKTKKYPWIVYEEDEKVLGYAYVGKWKERSAYRHTVEDTIYIKESERGKGIGQKLFEGLMEEVEKDKEIHVIMGVIALPNEKSVQIHERNGFRKAAHFREVGYKNNKWIDGRVLGEGSSEIRGNHLTTASTWLALWHHSCEM